MARKQSDGVRMTRVNRQKSQPRQATGCDVIELLENRILFTTAFAATTSSTSDPNLLALIGQSQTADIDADGKADLVIGTNTAGGTASLTGTDVLLSTGIGTFTVHAGPAFPAASATSTNVFAVDDINHDGKPDLIYASQSNDSNLDAVITPELNTSTTGTASFTAAAATTIATPASFNPQQIVTGDFNRDNNQDVAILGLTGSSEAVVVLSGNSAGGFTESYHTTIQVVSGTPLTDGVLLTGDFTDQGQTDLAVYDPSSGEITFLYNTSVQDGAISFSQTTAPVSLNIAGYTPGPIATAALKPTSAASDLIVGENSTTGGSDVVAVFNATGTGSTIGFTAEPPVPAGNPAGDAIANVTPAVFNDNGLDFVDVATDYGVLLGNGQGGLSSPIAGLSAGSRVGTQGFTALLAGDLNGDGLPDLIGVNQANHTAVAALNQSTPPTGNITAPTTTALAASNTTIAAGHAITLTATVTSTAATPSGYVDFLSNGTLLGSAGIGTGGTATLSTTALAAGTDALTAEYLGNAALTASTSTVIDVTVTGSTGTGTGTGTGAGTGAGTGTGTGTTAPTLPDASTLHPSLAALKLPTQEVAGQKISLLVPVTLTNTADATYTGAVTISVYASDAAGFNGSQQLLVTQAVKRLALRAGKSATVRVRVTAFPTALTGAVNLVATVADSSGNATGVASATTATVAAPYSALITTVPTLKSTTSVVGGSKSTGYALVTVTNTGNVTYTGTASVALVPSTTTTASATATALNTVTIARLVLRPKAARRLRVPLKVNPPATSAKTDYILARTTDASGNVTVGASSTTITVAPPLVALTATATPTTAAFVAGRHSTASLLVTLTNAGNIAATGTATATIYASTTPTLAAHAVAFSTVALKVSVAASRTQRVRLSLALLSRQTPGTYYLIVDVTGLTATAVAAVTASPVTISAA